MGVTIPEKMWALQLQEYGGPDGLKVVEVDVPKPKSGQVLIKMEASPVNPSDTAFLKGVYGVKKDLPCIPGFEGSGTVVGCGGGLMAWRLQGKRVSCVADNKLDGTWAQYMVAPAVTCVPMGKGLSFEQGASAFVNPLTCMSFLNIAKKGKHKAVVQTAAASQLGRMVLRTFKNNGIEVINVVRRQEQVDLLTELGAKYVVNSSEEDFETKLRDLCKEMKVTLAFDSVFGDAMAALLKCLEKRGRVLVYGSLSMKPLAGVDASHFIFLDKKVEGFWLTTYLKNVSILDKMKMTSGVQSLLGGSMSTEYQARCELKDAAEGIKAYIKNMTGGKCLIMPNTDAAAVAAGDAAASAAAAEGAAADAKPAATEVAAEKAE